MVIANLPPETLVNTDYDTLKAIKPDIILTTVALEAVAPSTKVGRTPWAGRCQATCT